MTEPRCEVCGKPAAPSPLGTLLCLGCCAQYDEFRCGQCGQRVVYLREIAPDHPELLAGICSLCHMRARVAQLPVADREAIRAAAERGTLAGIKAARDRLGWSISEAVSLVHVLRGSAQPSAPADCGGM